MKIGLISFLLVFLSCSRWEYEDLSIESLESFPETYLSLLSVDTIFARTDSIGNVIYSFDETHDSLHVWDTIGNAFNTISTSRQKLNWWGEDVDGNVVGGIGMSGGNGQEDTKVGLAALQALADHYKDTSYKIEVAADIKK